MFSAKSWNLPEAVTSYRQTFLSEGDQINHPASPLATSPVTSDNPWRKPPSLVSQNAGLKSQSTASSECIFVLVPNSSIDHRCMS